MIGPTGFFDTAGRIKSMGIQCALCHSTVDDSFAPGIGRRLDGWPNRDLNVAVIINLAPEFSPFTAALQVETRPIISHVAQAMLSKYGAIVRSRSGAVRLVRG